MSERLIAIAAQDEHGLDGEVSMHFGRCPFYVLVQVDGCEVKGVEIKANPFFDAHQPGQVPRFIGDLGANVMLAGGMGPRAQMLFRDMGIDVATGAVGNVGKVLEAYLDGRFSGTVPCGHDHPDSCGGH